MIPNFPIEPHTRQERETSRKCQEWGGNSQKKKKKDNNWRDPSKLTPGWVEKHQGLFDPTVDERRIWDREECQGMFNISGKNYYYDI